MSEQLYWPLDAERPAGMQGLEKAAGYWTFNRFGYNGHLRIQMPVITRGYSPKDQMIIWKWGSGVLEFNKEFSEHGKIPSTHWRLSALRVQGRVSAKAKRLTPLGWVLRVDLTPPRGGSLVTINYDFFSNNQGYDSLRTDISNIHSKVQNRMGQHPSFRASGPAPSPKD